MATTNTNKRQGGRSFIRFIGRCCCYCIISFVVILILFGISVFFLQAYYNTNKTAEENNSEHDEIPYFGTEEEKAITAEIGAANFSIILPLEHENTTIQEDGEIPIKNSDFGSREMNDSAPAYPKPQVEKDKEGHFEEEVEEEIIVEKKKGKTGGSLKKTDNDGMKD